MKHSPEPWTALKTGLIVDANNAVVVPDVYGDDQEKKEANANLIAAAPELLRILKSMASYYACIHQWPGGLIDCSECSGLNGKHKETCRYGYALEIIAKAEGK